MSSIEYGRCPAVDPVSEEELGKKIEVSQKPPPNPDSGGKCMSDCECFCMPQCCPTEYTHVQLLNLLARKKL